LTAIPAQSELTFVEAELTSYQQGVSEDVLDRRDKEKRFRTVVDELVRTEQPM
jgi:hypothetical protein